MATVVCIVLTWNNYADTDECVASLLAQDYTDHEILVVDNGSTDGSPARLRERWDGRVQFVETGANLGCGGGYNAGLQWALESGAQYFAIIDNDVVARPGLLSALLRPFQDEPCVALSTAVLTYFDDPERVWFARGTYQNLLGLTRHPGIGRKLSQIQPLPAVAATDYAPSCAVMLSRAAVETVGLMDERFFFGHDDVDWCLRARRAGFRLLVVGEPLALHKVSTTGGSRGSAVFTAFSAYHHAAGSLLVGAKHYHGLALAPYLFGQFAVRAPYYSLQMASHGRWSGVVAYWRGLAAGVRKYLVHPARAE